MFYIYIKRCFKIGFGSVLCIDKFARSGFGASSVERHTEHIAVRMWD